MKKLIQFFEKMFMPERQVFLQKAPSEVGDKKPDKGVMTPGEVGVVMDKANAKIADLEASKDPKKLVQAKRLKRVIKEMTTYAEEKDGHMLLLAGGELKKKLAAIAAIASAELKAIGSDLAKLDAATMGELGKGVKVEGVGGETPGFAAPKPRADMGVKLAGDSTKGIIPGAGGKRLADIGVTGAAAEGPEMAGKAQEVEGPAPGPAPEEEQRATAEKYAEVKVPDDLKRQARADVESNPGLTEQRYKDPESGDVFIAKFEGAPEQKMIRWRKEGLA